MSSYLLLATDHPVMVPQVNEVEIFGSSLPTKFNRRLLPAKNKLISKRHSDKVNERLESVIHKPNAVAVAVTRLQATNQAISTGGTPEESEEVVEKKFTFLDTSQLLKLTGTRTVSPSPSHSRLHSIRN
jgi:hypothetical protein